MSKTNIKNTSVPPAYDPPMTTLEYLQKVQEQNAQVLARQDEIEEALNDRVAKSGDTMTGALNVPQVNADTGVLHHMNVVSQDGNTHVEVSNGGFIAEVTEETTGNKKYGVIAYPNGKVGFYAHDALHNKDVNFIVPNMDDYEAGTYELATKDDIPSGGSSLLEDIEDADGHKRFQKTLGVVVNNIFDTNKYATSIVNGLILELVGYIKSTNGGSLAGNIVEYSVPQWVYDLLIADESGIVTLFQAATNSTAMLMLGVKKQNGKLYVYKPGVATTASAGYELRINLALGL